MSQNPKEQGGVGRKGVGKDHLGQVVKSPIYNAKVSYKRLPRKGSQAEHDVSRSVCAGGPLFS